MPLTFARRAAGLALAIAALAASSRANGWIVAPVPGPGVDFTNIQTAINTVAPGDLLEVRPGAYGGFVLAKGLSIFGTAPGVSFGDVTVQNVGGGPRVQLARWSCRKLSVLDCARVVVLDELAIVNTETLQVIPAYGARVERCADVRMLRVTISSVAVTRYDDEILPALSVRDARVELVRCSLTGQSGDVGGQLSSVDDLPAMPGSAALYLGPNAIAHVSLSQLQGGKGGDFGMCIDLCSPVAPGNGGDAIAALGPNACVFVTGQPADICRGGNAGLASYFLGPVGPAAAPGRGLRVTGGNTARVSGATFLAGGIGSNATPSGPAIVAVGTVTEPLPADPSLEMSPGPQLPGDVVTFVVHAEPGSTVRLRWGRRPIVEDIDGWAEDRLVEQIRSYFLGVVPASGDVSWTMSMPPASPIGALIVFQGTCIETNGATEFTQSWPTLFR